MKGSTRSRDIVIPKGVCVCYPIIGGGLSAEGIDLGWCQEAKLSVAEEVKQIYSARDASRALAAERVTKRDYSLPLTLVSANAQNLALLFRGSKGSQIQAGGNYGVTALDINAPTELDRLKKLGKRGVSITRINYDGGTSAFSVGQTLSTGGSTATIVWVAGTTVMGSLFVVNLSGSEFIDDAVLADDGGTPGAAVQNGVVTVLKDIVLTDAAGTTRYDLGIDYGLDPKSGSVSFLADGNISAAESLKAYFDYGALTEVTINPGDEAPSYYQVEILPFGGQEENLFEFNAWKCSVKADTELPLITEADDEMRIDLVMTPLTDGPGATTSHPVFKLIQHTGS